MSSRLEISSDIELRKIICIRMGCFQLHLVLLCVFICLIVKTTYAQIEVNILPITFTQGGTLNASYNQRVSGTPTCICYRSNGTGPINTSSAAIVQVHRIPSMQIPLQACSVPKTQLRTHPFLSRGATLVKYIYEQGLYNT